MTATLLRTKLHRPPLPLDVIERRGLVTSWLTDAKHRTRQSQSHPPQNLTNREIEILELFDKRLRNQEIADQLFISITTVKKHTSNLYEKLAVGGRREATDRAHELGLLSRF